MSKKTCFFVTPIGQEGSDERQNSDDVLEFLVNPALSDEFEVIRVDKVDEAGKINETILNYLKKSELVIVDMSFHNPNVFYEYGFRHSLDLPLVPIINKNITQTIPFDVYNLRTIFYSTNVRDLENAKSSLKNTVRNLKPAMDEMDGTDSTGTKTHSQDLSVPFMNVNDKLDEILTAINSRNDSDIDKIVNLVAKNTRPNISSENRMQERLLDELMKDPSKADALIQLQHKFKGHSS